jgi:hypothetical protein
MVECAPSASSSVVRARIRAFAATLWLSVCGSCGLHRTAPPNDVGYQSILMLPSDSRPTLDLPRRDAQSKLHLRYPAGAIRLSDGRVAVADGLGLGVVYYDSMGHIDRAVSLEAMHLGSVSWFGACGGDSVFAWSRRLGHMVVLDHLGRLVRDFDLSPARFGSRWISALACSRDGAIAVLARGNLPRPMSGVDPVSWRPHHLGWRFSRWPNVPIPPSSVSS